MREQIEGYYNVHDEKYGYILSEDRKELLVEEEAATIVREVFQMLLDGVSVKKIADIMNERGVESPMVHNARDARLRRECGFFPQPVARANA